MEGGQGKVHGREELMRQMLESLLQGWHSMLHNHVNIVDARHDGTCIHIGSKGVTLVGCHG